MGPADREIHELLRAMGLTRVYRGYGYLFYILRRGLDDPQWLVSGNKQVFLDTARACAAAPTPGARARRPALRSCWPGGPGPLPGRATPRQPLPGLRPFLLRLGRLCRQGDWRGLAQR